MSALPMPVDELAAAGASVTLLAGYHAFLHYMSRRDPAYTVQRTNEHVRTLWVEGVMRQGKDILGVQTLRNSTMAATFLASTSVVLVVGLLSVVAKPDTLATTSAPKLLLVLLDLFIAFFGFAMSVRLYSHVGYMIGIPAGMEGCPVSPSLVARHLNRAAAYYSAAMRAFYFLVPLVFWFFGPLALVLSTLALMVLLFSNDRSPRDQRDPSDT